MGRRAGLAPAWPVGSLIPVAGSRPLREGAHEEGALGCCAQRQRFGEQQGVFGACARLCPGSRALRARPASLSVPTRTGSAGTRRDPQLWVLGPVSPTPPIHPSQLAVGPCGSSVGGGLEKTVGPPSSPFSTRGTYTETGWRKEAKA